ncbi:MAG: phytanoyl-CoA dioxygenase family protein [Verrucomicrobia bacterium]|nr:phytanoyl-CoA dioxygenase family protein [Verrucomicrobiota bacterium]MDA1087520.1 phytanoyl-CoA dioxygenase family protein [Verrucomicrobiota bacterium]
MTIDSNQFHRDGFLILKNVVPPERLEHLRPVFEELVDKQKKIWAGKRTPDEPPGGRWDTSPQPRLLLQELVDATTSDAIDFCLGETTIGMSRQLVGGPDTAIHYMSMMCNPVKDHGPDAWHRDVTTGQPAPLEGIQELLKAYGAQYVQWNIALYDDDVLWVVPGSHLRRNTPEEDRQLAEDSRVPLPGALQVNLKAGDGVVYALPILHWGSNYSPKMRRCIHLGFRAFGGDTFPYVFWRHYDTDFISCLPPSTQQQFEKFDELWQEEHKAIARIFRSILDRDTESFNETLAQLHRGETGRIVALVMLSKIVSLMQQSKAIDQEDLPKAERDAKLKTLWYGTRIFKPFCESFSASDVSDLGLRFSALDSKLKRPEARVQPGFQGPESEYDPNQMPVDFDLEDFVNSW